MINAPSLANCNFLQLADDLAALIEGGVEVVHVDVMDGHFVPNITIGPDVVKALRPHTAKPFDVPLIQTRHGIGYRIAAPDGAG